MTRKIEDDDYLDLWKYFEDRADNVKEAMFTSVTWVIGFAAAVFGFIFAALVNFEGGAVTLKSPRGALGASIIGLVLCVYALLLVREAKGHILANWDRAKRCKVEVEGLETILGPERAKGWLGIQVWTQILIVVAVFAAGFSGVFVWASR